MIIVIISQVFAITLWAWMCVVECGNMVQFPTVYIHLNVSRVTAGSQLPSKDSDRIFHCFVFFFLNIPLVSHLDFPGGSDGKASCWQCRRPGFDPWVGKILWRRKWQPTPVLLPGKSHGQRSLVGYSPWGRKESDTTEQLHFHVSLCFSSTHCCLVAKSCQTLCEPVDYDPQAPLSMGFPMLKKPGLGEEDMGRGLWGHRNRKAWREGPRVRELGF